MNTSFQGTSEKGTDTWLTPRWILDPLGEFDLDPACPENMPWKTAKHMLTPKEDGLKCNWCEDYRIFLNPPYGRSGMDKWLSKMAKHNNGIMLVYASTGVAWFRDYIWNKASSVFFVEGRIKFCDITGKVPVNEKGQEQSPGKDSVLVGYGEGNDAILKNQIMIPGKFIQLR